MQNLFRLLILTFLFFSSASLKAQISGYLISDSSQQRGIKLIEGSAEENAQYIKTFHTKKTYTPEDLK